MNDTSLPSRVDLYAISAAQITLWPAYDMSVLSGLLDAEDLSNVRVLGAAGARHYTVKTRVGADE